LTRELWKYVQTHKDRMIVNRTDIPTGSALKLLQPELAKIHHPLVKYEYGWKSSSYSLRLFTITI
jgi:hypothetical protein